MMQTCNPVNLLFGGMEKLGPGGNIHTHDVLRLLPKRKFDTIVDAGCGTGRQTIVLAKTLGTLVNAVDTYKPFLDDLARRAKKAGIEHLVCMYCMDMKDIPGIFQHIDLLWSEGAAYNIGFADALTTWAPAIVPDSFIVASELSWISEQVPDEVEEFFLTGYPEVQSVLRNIEMAEQAGYEVQNTFTLPHDAWVEGYYEILEPRARVLSGHPDSSVRELAVETIREIEVFEGSESS